MKVHVLTLGHAPARTIRAGLARFYETHHPQLPITHWLVDHHYPLRHAETRLAIDSAALAYGAVVLDPGRNLGLHGGANWAFTQMGIKSGDILIMYDPDSYPLQFGWDAALMTAITQGGLSVACLSLIEATRHELDTRGFTRRQVGPLEIDEPKVPCMMSVTALQWDFIAAAGGFQEPNACYGGLEGFLWSKLAGRRWGYLTGYQEDQRVHRDQDPEYRAWKVAHAHTGAWPGDFPSFLAAGCSGLMK